jgi:hypothetical protein
MKANKIFHFRHGCNFNKSKILAIFDFTKMASRIFLLLLSLFPPQRFGSPERGAIDEPGAAPWGKGA